MRSKALAIIVIVAFLAVGAAAQAWTIDTLRDEQHRSCVEDLGQYDALRSVIVESYKPQPPNPAIVRLFPQLEPFYTPGNPQYDDARARAIEHRDRVLGVLGHRPNC